MKRGLNVLEPDRSFCSVCWMDSGSEFLKSSHYFIRPCRDRLIKVVLIHR